MPRAKTPSPAATTASQSPAPSDTRHLFAGPRKANERGASVTSERIAHDLAQFRKSGGRIEVLGTTRTLTRVDAPVAEAPTPAPRKRKGG
ncbi:hypothetical protein CMZ84_13730 [Lysobacteraceae bacterium NML93-0399]|nr:hypothetical protein CMZ84_13730 [Xanthomonadaceae bacterium NML93-0399]